ncbi:hypothetical protein EZS27_041767, partial [termite gut metagenome]
MNKQLILVVALLLVFLPVGKIGSQNKVSGKDTWVKYENNPVLGGGDLGTIFDISVLKVGDVYKMYCSWRPKRSLALSTSTDGKNWTTPQIILGPNDANEWEKDLNRPAVVLKDNVYHLWYTGQAKGKSWIG